MKALSVFSFQEIHPVRVVMVDGNPWFVAKDICDALGLTNSRVSLDALDDDEKGVTSTYTLAAIKRYQLFLSPAFIPSSCAVVTR